MITKTRLINSLEKLPENLSIDDLVDHVILMEKFRRGWMMYIDCSLQCQIDF